MTNSQIIARMTGLLFPFILLFGFYIVLNGHVTPGGGFQGGAVLASVFISRYLVYPIQDFRISSLQLLEKVFLICIILLPAILLFSSGNRLGENWNVWYLITTNLFIGLKVCSGLTIIFFRFVFHEEGK